MAVDKKLRGIKIVGMFTGPDNMSITSAKETLLEKLSGKLPMQLKAGKGKNAVTLTIGTQA